MTAQTWSPARASAKPLLSRLALALAAVAVVAGALALVAWIGAADAPPPTPVRGPFGLAREAAPAPTGIGGVILAWQGSFYRSLQGAVLALKANGAALWTLLGIGFAYGVFHAAGPGHGKAVIAGYLVASERALLKGFALSLAAALLQALVAIGLVLGITIAFKATAATMSQVTNAVELGSFVAVTALGVVLTWRKAGKLLRTAAAARGEAAPEAACDHVHLPPPDTIDRLTRFRDLAGVVLAAGIRPCAGALVVLVFTLSQGLLPAGIAAVVAMALGTALTTGAIAALAVFAKGLALRLAGGRGARGEIAAAGLELLAAAFVLVIGLSLLTGLLRGTALS
ncbi:nickel/cobalt transporter [Salinarimonas soli]|uniref:Nickel/cobalt efflux system n=1 Tax=Salinarimonas soli TaxID=1638099 RepID=A0A5B2VD25_9HYPH|nr:nickel transporter [Salinarimonas soli]KAA2237393.1 nickel transporter [Salinarimonas soli]